MKVGELYIENCSSYIVIRKILSVKATKVVYEYLYTEGVESLFGYKSTTDIVNTSNWVKFDMNSQLERIIYGVD